MSLGVLRVLVLVLALFPPLITPEAPLRICFVIGIIASFIIDLPVLFERRAVPGALLEGLFVKAATPTTWPLLEFRLLVPVRLLLLAPFVLFRALFLTLMRFSLITGVGLSPLALWPPVR